MWLCEDKLKRKTVHFRLPSASQKRACLSSLKCLAEAYSRSKKRFWREINAFFDTVLLEIDLGNVDRWQV